MERQIHALPLLTALCSLGLAPACSSDEAPGAGATGGSATGGVASGGDATGGVAPTAGTPVSGGAPSGGKGGSMSAGGNVSAGSGGGGVGGQPAAGGAGQGGGGTGSGGQAGGASTDLIANVTGIKNDFGFALRDSFYLVPCFSVSAQDCATAMGACPNQSAAEFEDRGAVFKEDFTLGGEAGKTYKVTIQVNGITEGKYYSGGMRRDGSNYASANAATGGDGWHVGGSAVASTYNVYKLTVLKPGGSDEVQHYYLNSFPMASGFESHQTVLLGYEATFDAPGGGVVRFTRVDSNCKAINNCGSGTHNADCPSPRKLPNEPDLPMPAMYGGQSVASMNSVNGAMQPYHSQLVHVTVKKVEASASP